MTEPFNASLGPGEYVVTREVVLEKDPSPKVDQIAGAVPEAKEPFKDKTPEAQKELSPVMNGEFGTSTIT
jgi:hypothetical protein